MTQFINKSIIKAEIERLVKEYRLSNSAEAKYRCKAYGELLDFINSLQEEPVSEDLEEAAKKAGQKYFPNENNIWARPNYEAMAAENAFKEGAKWGMEQAEVKIQAQSIAVAHGCPKEPVSGDLKEAADNYVGHAPEINEDLSCFTKRKAFIAGSQWQEKQSQKTIELAEDHAYLAGQEKIITKACEWLSKVSIEDMTYKYDDFDTSEGWYKFIEDFKKAMEE